MLKISTIRGQLDEWRSLRENAFPLDQRKPTGFLGAVVALGCVGLTLLTLYMAFNVTFGPIPTRALHLMFVIPLTFLLYPALARWRERGPSLLDYLLASLGFATFAWAVYSADRFQLRDAYFDPVDPIDLTFGIIAILVVFEATRRTVGKTIVFINVTFMAYAITGPIWPGLLAHKGTNFHRLIEHTYMLSDGLFNFIMGIMATFLFTFLTFGAILRVSGGDRVRQGGGNFERSHGDPVGQHGQQRSDHWRHDHSDDDQDRVQKLRGGRYRNDRVPRRGFDAAIDGGGRLYHGGVYRGTAGHHY